MTSARNSERLVYDPPFGLSAHDALRRALKWPDQIAPREVQLHVTARIANGRKHDFSGDPLPLVKRIVAPSGLIQIEGEAHIPPQGLKRRLPKGPYRVRLFHPAFEPAFEVFNLPVRPPVQEALDEAAPSDGDAHYKALLDSRRHNVLLRPGANYPLPSADTPPRPSAESRIDSSEPRGAYRSLLVVAGRFADPFAGTVRLAKPQTDAPGGVAEPGAPVPSHAFAKPAPSRGFALWTALPKDEQLLDGELDIALEPSGGGALTLTYKVDLTIDDPGGRATLVNVDVTVDEPGARATLVRLRGSRGRVMPRSLTILVL